MRRFLLVIVALAVGLSLTACGATDDPWNVRTSAGFDKACDSRVQVSNALSVLQHEEPSSDRNDALAAWGFPVNSSDVDENGKLREVFNDRIDSLKSKLSDDCKTTSASASSSPTATPSATETPKPGDDGKATVTDGGKKTVVPLVKTADGSPTADTTDDPMTPASLPDGLCPTLVDWSTLVKCVEDHDMSWYIDGVNQRKASTGFDWTDIKRWAKDPSAEVRAIEVYGQGISDAEARKRAAELVGGMKVARSLAIVRQPECFDNTRGLEDKVMQDFVYCPPNSREVRVSLLPATMKDGKITGILDTDSGVFVDCVNLWWIPDVVKTPGKPPQVNKPPKNPPPVCTKKCGPPSSGGCETGCTHKCPPGSTKPECSPKHGDFHGGGVPSGSVTEPASSPKPVETSRPGGGGVVDTPTNKPGSESGVTAPGASPAPSSPSPTPTPEGGANDGSGGGSDNPPPEW